MSVENAFAIGVSSEARSLPALRAASSLPRCARSMRDGGGVADRARAPRQRPHGQQHALHVGMLDDRAVALADAALLAVVRVSQRLLRGAVGDRHALQADREARLVHHREHAGDARDFLRRSGSRSRRRCRP